MGNKESFIEFSNGRIDLCFENHDGFFVVLFTSPSKLTIELAKVLLEKSTVGFGKPSRRNHLLLVLMTIKYKRY